MFNDNKKPKIKKYISVRGARLHNLKNISVDIPRNELTVITGVSGSGKSSLAFDTVFAEGQRCFVESLSAYARQFLERMDKPDVDTITGLPPAIAIEQRPAPKNPRSTVGTATEIYDYFRLLYGRVGTTICKKCGKPVKKDSPSSIVQSLQVSSNEDKIYILFPLNNHKNEWKKEVERFVELGFTRIIPADSEEIIDLQEKKLPSKLKYEDILFLADRLVVQSDKESLTRLTDSIETALTCGNGHITIKNLIKGERYLFSSKFECSECDIVYVEPEPRLFSFNNPFGACPSCEGFGRTIGIDDDLVIPNKSKTIRAGAVHPFRTTGFSVYQRQLLKIAPKFGINVDDQYDSLPDNAKQIIWEGAEDYAGINGFFAMLEENSYKMHYRIITSRYRGYSKCKACSGARLRTSARQVFVGGKNLPEIIQYPFDKLLDFIRNIELNSHQLNIAGQVLKEILWRLELLVSLGLEYLTLDRLTHTLSGGESQRINLSTALGSALVGTLYVLDEPSIGMHPVDTKRLLDILFKMRNIGNTVLVVEHDPDIIKAADFIIDMGPLAGENGGEIIFAGNYSDLLKSDESLTGRYFSNKINIEFPEKKSADKRNRLTILNARKHNLKIDKVEFPLECMNVVTGVSGSGKSTLVHDVLFAGLTKYDAGFADHPGYFDKILGSEHIQHVEIVDQSPIGKSSRSTPATYTKIFDTVRELFAQTQLARQLGWKPGNFSFNVPGGRCETCEGEGYVTVDMQFLSDVRLVCESCSGSRYKKEVHSILFREKSIVDVLNMTIDEATIFFEGYNKITKKLNLLRDVGLGYLRLGQPSTMLSGGESQRLKLSNHLDSSTNTSTLYIFDEPTTGLHLDDISKLLECFRRLIRQGHSVIIIEHNLYVIAAADNIIDLGPGAGEKGGRLVASGSPNDVIKVKESLTGAALKDFLKETV